VTMAVQEEFCGFSGDRNPTHADPVVARRTPVGEITVHGAHTLLWSLESLASNGLFTRPPSRLKVKYLRPLLLDCGTTLTVASGEGLNPVSIQVEAEGFAVFATDLVYDEPVHLPEVPDGCLTPLESPLDLSFADFEGRRGEAYVASAAAARRAFPALAQIAGARLVAELAACSYVVGMEAPGLYSMSARMNLAVRPGRPRPGLGYEIVYADQRFRNIRLALTGSTIEGTLDALVRVSS
jgi:MaoC like domain